MSHRSGTTNRCQSSNTPAPHTAPAPGAPPNSPSPTAPADPACTATTPAANAPTNTATASPTNEPPRPLPGQTRGQTWTGTGYERTLTGLFDGNGRVHALRTSVRPEGHRRETLCGLLAPPLPGHHFNTLHQRACTTCTTITTNNPLRYGINPSNELAQIRALLNETREQRITPTDTINWITTNDPLAA
jgi:hypothetical protein